MNMSKDYILLLGQRCDESKTLQGILKQMHCPFSVAYSPEQAVVQIEQKSPYLVILSGNRTYWSSPLIERLRETAKAAQVMIVALTESHEPSWSPHESHPGVDGFLVKPLSSEVLSSVVESALAQLVCHP
jgi:PleD family two-component response regulator